MASMADEKPGRTAFERLEEAAKRLLREPKDEVKKAELRLKKEREAEEAAAAKEG